MEAKKSGGLASPSSCSPLDKRQSKDTALGCPEVETLLGRGAQEDQLASAHGAEILTCSGRKAQCE